MVEEDEAEVMAAKEDGVDTEVIEVAGKIGVNVADGKIAVNEVDGKTEVNEVDGKTEVKEATIEDVVAEVVVVLEDQSTMPKHSVKWVTTKATALEAHQEVATVTSKEETL